MDDRIWKAIERSIQLGEESDEREAIWLRQVLIVVKPPPARRSGSVAGVTGACVCDGWGLNWLRVG